MYIADLWAMAPSLRGGLIANRHHVFIRLYVSASTPIVQDPGKLCASRCQKDIFRQVGGWSERSLVEAMDRDTQFYKP
ncbi:MAG: hypothetical protein VX570_05025, partial [Pseudomonadota bacterium]|nr:hypothetical protein [Pseudomonadota bacterium]